MTHPMPDYVAGGLSVLDALYAEKFEGGTDLHARTANHGGGDIVTDEFTMRAYCWCDGDRIGHADGCPPNFEHRDSGLRASWYKHSERNAECNREVSATEWAQIQVDCSRSLLDLPPAYRVLITGSREYGVSLTAPGRKKVYRDDWTTAPSPQRDAMVAALRAARTRAGGRPMVIVHGDAAGADTLAAMLASRSGCATEPWPALWRREDGSIRGGYDRAEALRVRSVYNPGGRYYSKAGPERNQAMVDAGADECLAFKSAGAKNIGTSHCIKIATAAGIPTTVVEQ